MGAFLDGTGYDPSFLQSYEDLLVCHAPCCKGAFPPVSTDVPIDTMQSNTFRNDMRFNNPEIIASVGPDDAKKIGQGKAP